MNAVLDKQHHYVAEFPGAEPTLLGYTVPWLKALRTEAIASFGQLGFPTQRDEAWRFTPIHPITETFFKRATHAHELDAEAINALYFKGLGSLQLVFIDGQFSRELSTIPDLPMGVEVESLRDAIASEAAELMPYLGQLADFRKQAFAALNTAYFDDGAYIVIPKKTVLETPIHILHVSTASAEPSVVYPRCLIVAEPESRATVIESYVSAADGKSFTNAITEIFVGDNARLDHFKLERESLHAAHVSALYVKQGRSSVLNSCAILLGGEVVRNDITVTLAGDGAEAELNGLYLATGTQLIDSHTAIDHAETHTTSRELYKGVLDDKSQAVFDGHVLVRPVAQKTDAAQSNRNLLLSHDAKINTKPELKIFANDVKCKHGATVGQINPDSLFYMRSRGIPEERARRLLVFAFASEIIEKISVPALRQALSELLFEKFQR